MATLNALTVELLASSYCITTHKTPFSLQPVPEKHNAKTQLCFRDVFQEKKKRSVPIPSSKASKKAAGRRPFSCIFASTSHRLIHTAPGSPSPCMPMVRMRQAKSGHSKLLLLPEIASLGASSDVLHRKLLPAH